LTRPRSRRGGPFSSFDDAVQPSSRALDAQSCRTRARAERQRPRPTSLIPGSSSPGQRLVCQQGGRVGLAQREPQRAETAARRGGAVECPLIEKQRRHRRVRFRRLRVAHRGRPDHDDGDCCCGELEHYPGYPLAAASTGDLCPGATAPSAWEQLRQSSTPTDATGRLRCRGPNTRLRHRKRRG
jgi:hypothetical protein